MYSFWVIGDQLKIIYEGIIRCHGGILSTKTSTFKKSKTTDFEKNKLEEVIKTFDSRITLKVGNETVILKCIPSRNGEKTEIHAKNPYLIYLIKYSYSKGKFFENNDPPSDENKATSKVFIDFTALEDMDVHESTIAGSDSDCTTKY